MASSSTTINLASGQKADRKLLMTFANVGTAGGPDYEWEIMGRGVEDSSIEYNHDTNQTTDILGMSDTDVSPAKPAQELDPNTIRGGNKLSEKLLDIERRKALSELGTFDVLVVHCYLGTATTGPFTAEVPKNSTIVPTSLGGSSYVGMPLTVYLSNDMDLGTVTIAEGVPTFTKDGTE